MELFGLEFIEKNIEQFLDDINNDIRNKEAPFFIHTVNVDHIVQMHTDIELYKAATEARYVTADGMPIVLLGRLLGKKFYRVTGSDLTVLLCNKSKKNGLRLFFLGAAPEVLKNAVSEARKLYDADIVGFYSPSAYEIADHEMTKSICNLINCSGANVLLVALGAPKQEKWIINNLCFLNTIVNIGVGASIDFIAGSQKRAPRWVQNIGMEWFYRLIQEPRRMAKRYLVRDSVFFLLLAKEVYKKYRSKNKR